VGGVMIEESPMSRIESPAQTAEVDAIVRTHVSFTQKQGGE